MPCEFDFIRVDDDYIVACVNVRGVCGLAFAREYARDDRREPSY